MKNILFITYDYPYPTNTGGKNRAYHMLKYGGNHKKYLISFIRDDFKKNYVSEMEKIGVKTLATIPRRKIYDLKNPINILLGQSIFKSLYLSKNVEDKILSAIKEHSIDVVHYESFYTGFYISADIKKIGVKQVYGTENVEHKLYREYADNTHFLLRHLYQHQVSRIKKEEQRMYKNADISIAVSDNDASEIKKFTTCEIVRNGVDINDFKLKKQNDNAHNILFVGNFTYFPNIDAVNFFYENVFSKIDNETEFVVIGKKATSLSCANRHNVKAIEFVPDIKDAYRDADIMVSPIRLGGGTNFKVLEAMAAGVPVVALPDRLEGLDVSDGKDILIARSAADFLEKIKNLLDDKKMREMISKNARNTIEKKYSWDVIGRKLSEVWEEL